MPGSACLLAIVCLATSALAQGKGHLDGERTTAVDRQRLDELVERVRRQTELIESLKQQVARQQHQLDEQSKLLRQLRGQKQEEKSPTEVRHSGAPSSDRSSTSSTALAKPTREGTPERAGQHPGDDHLERGSAGWNDNHAFIRNRNGTFEAVFPGYGQFDYRAYEANDENLTNTFLIRRARFSIGGRIHQRYEYKLQADFADSQGTILRDGWIKVNLHPFFQLRIGQLKEPFSHEELRDDDNNDFVERSMVNNLVPRRSPGMELAGEFSGGILSYQIGAFNGKGLLAPNTTSTPEGVFRLRLRPWIKRDGHRLEGLSFGGAVARGRERGGMSFMGRTESRSATFSLPVNGSIVRANAELTYLYRGFALRSKYVRTHQARTGLAPHRTNLPPVIGNSMMIQGTYLLTGEEKLEDGPVTPRKGLWNEGRPETDIGAWELKFRYSNLQLADGMRSGRAEPFSTGLNWYLTRSAKYMLDVNFERFADPRHSPRPGERGFLSVLTRMQFTF